MSSSLLEAFVWTIALRVTILAEKHRDPGGTLDAIIECKNTNGDDALGPISMSINLG